MNPQQMDETLFEIANDLIATGEPRLAAAADLILAARVEMARASGGGEAIRLRERLHTHLIKGRESDVRLVCGAFRMISYREGATMTADLADLEIAIQVLNAHRHRGQDDWALWDNGAMPVHGESFDYLSCFEAVAIADRYMSLETITPFPSNS